MEALDRPETGEGHTTKTEREGEKERSIKIIGAHQEKLMGGCKSDTSTRP